MTYSSSWHTPAAKQPGPSVPEQLALFEERLEELDDVVADLITNSGSDQSGDCCGDTCHDTLTGDAAEALDDGVVAATQALARIARQGTGDTALRAAETLLRYGVEPVSPRF